MALTGRTGLHRTGRQVPPEVLKRRKDGLQLEDSLQARPWQRLGKPSPFRSISSRSHTF